MARLKNSPPPAPPADSPAPATVDRHGPQAPVTVPYGIAHLRVLLNLHDPDVDRLCEDAALEITRLRDRVPAPR